jgi:hypothetical protein
MEAIFALIIVITPGLLIGAAIFAWMHGVGFRLIVNAPKQDVPGFFKRYLIQLSYLCLLAFVGYLFFKYLSNASLSDLNHSGSWFEPTKSGMLKGMIAYACGSLCVYIAIVGTVTKLVTRFGYKESFKSLVVVVIVSCIAYAGAIAYSYHAFIGGLPDEMPKVASNDQIQAGISIDRLQNPGADSVDISGIWTVNEEKSKSLCAKNDDDVMKIVCKSSVDSALITLANSDGILIRQDILQDGQNFCKIEVRNEEGFRYSCIDPTDRSIYARINANADGTLTFNVQLSTFVLSRKK